MIDHINIFFLKKPFLNKSGFLLIFLFTTLIAPFSTTGQGLTGMWMWENEEMRAEVFFADNKYYMEAFIINTQSQLSEGFSYYMIEGDTLIFNRIPITEGREPIAYHLIASISDYDMELIDLATGEKDYYTRINREYVQLEQYRKNEFYYAGGTVVCISEMAEKNYNNCLSFGNISVNSTLAEIESMLGKPFDKMEQAGRFYHVFLLQQLDDGSQPYFAVEIKNDQIVSIQITGNGSKEGLSFSSISLGDYYSFVEQKLGKPREIGFVDNETEHWSYTPFTFSLEIRNNYVYSIKLNKQ